VATYFCSPTGRVINAVLGPAPAGKLLNEARWAIDAFEPVRKASLQTQLQRLKSVSRMRSSGLRSGTVRTREQRLAAYLANHPAAYLDQIYEHVFENILGENLTTSGLTVAQAAEQIELARKTGRPLLFVIHDESDSDFKKKWGKMTQRSRTFDRNMRKQLADYVVVSVREDEQAALSRLTNRPPFESPGFEWPLFVVANSEGEQVDAVSGKWCSRSLSNALATNWIDTIGDRSVTERRVKLARFVHSKLGDVPAEKYDLLEERVANLQRSKRNRN